MSSAPQTWFVTGTSAGLGKALALEIVARGDNVAAAARNPADIADLVAEAPSQVLPLRCDVTRSEEIAVAIDQTLARFGAIDVLVNNAGYGLLSTIEEADQDQIDRQFAVNLLAPIALMRAVLPAMRARKRGTIVNVSSTAGARGMAGSGYYSASKAGLEALTEALAAEAAALGIRAIIVAPGPFRTDFFGRSIDTPGNPIADYRAIADQRAQWLAQDNAQRGDPARAARIIVDTVRSADPPLRLPLGGGACGTISTAYRAKLADIARSEQLAPQADIPQEAP